MAAATAASLCVSVIAAYWGVSQNQSLKRLEQKLAVDSIIAKKNPQPQTPQGVERSFLNNLAWECTEGSSQGCSKSLLQLKEQLDQSNTNP